MTNKILINTSNLHVGGGVQVATSFIYELSKLKDLPFKPVVYLSTEVINELNKLSADLSSITCKLYNTYGIKKFAQHKQEFAQFNIIFTVFGPFYFKSKGQQTVTGFAQAWIIYPNNEVYKTMPFLKKLKTKLRFNLHKLFFRRDNLLIVELDHVKNRLIHLGIKSSENIKVVRNCFSSLYLNKDIWEDIDLITNNNGLNIGFVSRDYPHKNLSILPKVKELLLDKHHIDAQFYITLTEQEWDSRDSNFKKDICNAGALSTTQCPTFYRKMDAIIFPSLLECFSATPLEAMIMKIPLFASDRGFVKDSCSEYAIYFDPINPESAADSIAAYFKRAQEDRALLLEEAQQHALSFSSAKERADQYIKILQSLAISE